MQSSCLGLQNSLVTCGFLHVLEKDAVLRFLQEDNFKYNWGTSVVSKGLDVANSLYNEARSVHQICGSKQCSFLLFKSFVTLLYAPLISERLHFQFLANYDIGLSLTWVKHVTLIAFQSFSVLLNLIHRKQCGITNRKCKYTPSFFKAKGKDHTPRSQSMQTGLYKFLYFFIMQCSVTNETVNFLNHPDHENNQIKVQLVISLLS